MKADTKFLLQRLEYMIEVHANTFHELDQVLMAHCAATEERLRALEESIANLSCNAEADAEEPIFDGWAERLKTAANHLKPPSVDNVRASLDALYPQVGSPAVKIPAESDEMLKRTMREAEKVKAHRDLMSGVVSPEDQHPAFLPRTRLELQRLITGMEDDFTPISEPEVVELARDGSGPRRFFIRRDVRYPNGVVHPQALSLDGQWVNRHVGFIVVGDDEIIWKGGR